ncbi:MAG TPA: hypothetical protein VKR29_11325, partial [Candidatus Binataceae bacterium]|nr:hypothetical protein [Candidatus Binataceae bacterium]
MANPKKELDTIAARLRESGFDASAPVADRIAQLRELRGKTDDIAIAAALGEINDPAAGEMLVEMEAGASGALRREVRRAIYKLRQHGIDVHESEVDAKGPTPAPAESGLTALMSPIDAEGAQIVWMIKARPRGGIIRLWGLVSETHGLAAVQNHALTRRELKTQLEDLERQAGVKLVDIDPRLADFILCDAYRRTSESDRLNVGTFYALRTEITGAPIPAELSHPVYTEFAKEAAGEPSIDLLKEDELKAFRFEQKELEPYLEEVNRANESVLVVSRSSQEDRIMGAVDKGIAELLSGERAQRLRRRLEDTALYLARTKRREQAGWAAAAAAKIRDGAELKTIPFFRSLVQTQLGALMAREAERKREETRLIMTPAEA